jgi:hypothetical protein
MISKFNLKKYISDELFIDKNDIKIEKTSYIYNINNKYLCKIVDISKNLIKKKMIMNEIYFYNNLYNNFSEIINILPFYKNITTSNKDIQGIVCKNIINCYKLDYYEDINIIYIIIDNISKLHIQYWRNTMILSTDKKLFFQEVYEENYNKYNSNYIIENIMKINIKDYFNNIYCENKDNEILQFFNKLLEQNDSLLIKSKKNKNNTIINGMLQIENIILTENDFIPYFRDWSLYKESYGIEDIIHLLIFSTKTDFLIKNYNEIFMYYYENINKYIEYSMEMFNEHIKYSLLDYILYKMIELYIKHMYLKLHEDKFNVYLDNYKYLVNEFIGEFIRR